MITLKDIHKVLLSIDSSLKILVGRKESLEDYYLALEKDMKEREEEWIDFPNPKRDFDEQLLREKGYEDETIKELLKEKYGN